MKKKATSYIDELSSGFDAQGYDQEQEGLAHEQEVAAENNWGSDNRDAVGRAAYVARKKRLATKLRRIATELEAIEKMDEDYQDAIGDTQESIEDIIDKVDYQATGASVAGEPVNVNAKKKVATKRRAQDDGGDEGTPENIDNMSDEDIEEQLQDDESSDMSDDDIDSTLQNGLDEENQDDPMAMEMGIGKGAAHPMEHDPEADDPNAFMSSQTGDEDWISIGPGTFDDQRNEVGKAAKKVIASKKAKK